MNNPDCRFRSARSTAVIAALVLVLTGCSLPEADDKPIHTLLPQELAEQTRLGQALQPQQDNNPGLTGIYPLADARDAFAARALLTTLAEQTIDVQYYIWRNDFTSTLLLVTLLEAADRGVRVRLLLDDNGINGLDNTLAALDRHPNFHVRLFNPFVVRSPKWLGYLTDFSRVHRRMHNKSFTVDNQMTIVGGRNVGDEYFGATDGLLFSDLDVIATGPVVHDVSGHFDEFWNSKFSFPADAILPPSSVDPHDMLVNKSHTISTTSAQYYLANVESVYFLEQLATGSLELTWAPTRMVSDPPDKIADKVPEKALINRQIQEAIGLPQHSLTLISPYFVPTAEGLEYFQELASRGVKVRILTNSLEATDVTPVHSGYARYRKPLLTAGIELFEMRRLGNGEEQAKESAGPLGSSGSSLHAKTFVVDEKRVFVGSFNFDPRSINLNTELGFVIESRELAVMMNAFLADQLSDNSYQVKLDRNDRLYWLEQNPEGNILHDHDPHTSTGRRALVYLMSLLPIEPLL